MHLVGHSLLNAILISGLVVIMMIMIESLNIESKGGFFAGLAKSRVGGVLVALSWASFQAVSADSQRFLYILTGCCRSGRWLL